MPKSAPSLVSSILSRLGFYLMTHVAPIGCSGGLVLAWRLGVELESFLTTKNNIFALCFSDTPPPQKKTVLGFYPIYMAPLKNQTSQPSRTFSLLLVRILLVNGSALVISTLFLINMKNYEVDL
jgi:hypothetical protein